MNPECATCGIVSIIFGLAAFIMIYGSLMCAAWAIGQVIGKIKKGKNESK